MCDKKTAEWWHEFDRRDKELCDQRAALELIAGMGRALTAAIDATAEVNVMPTTVRSDGTGPLVSEPHAGT